MEQTGALFEPEPWCALEFAGQRALLVERALAELGALPGVQDAMVEPGAPGREYDLTLALQTDVGRLRTPLWSHARARIFCDPSIHAANRRQLAPGHALAEALDRLRRRLDVRFTLESRGLTLQLQPEEGVERTWTAEHSRFRNRTAVTREDRIARAADVDVRDLLAHFYVGPSLRVVDENGEAFLLPAATEAEGDLISLCRACARYHQGAQDQCADCEGPVDVVVAVRPGRR